MLCTVHCKDLETCFEPAENLVTRQDVSEKIPIPHKFKILSKKAVKVDRKTG